MVKLKKYNGLLRLFVLFLTFIFFFSCQSKRLGITKIEGKEIKLITDYPEDSLIKKIIAPYKDSLDKDLSIVLAHCPETIDKTGEWQTPMGNYFADVSFLKANELMQSSYQLPVDLVLLNSGGIRTIIPKGDVTARNAYEIMPFENNLSVLELKGDQLLELLAYFISEHKPHPIAGITFTIAKNQQPTHINIQGKAFDPNASYRVATNDYLANGGDNMIFFKKALQRYDLHFKLRDVLIEHFKAADTIRAAKDQRVFIEN